MNSGPAREGRPFSLANLDAKSRESPDFGGGEPLLVLPCRDPCRFRTKSHGE